MDEKLIAWISSFPKDETFDILTFENKYKIYRANNSGKLYLLSIPDQLDVKTKSRARIIHESLLSLYETQRDLQFQLDLTKNFLKSGHAHNNLLNTYYDISTQLKEINKQIDKYETLL